MFVGGSCSDIFQVFILREGFFVSLVDYFGLHGFNLRVYYCIWIFFKR